MTPAELTAYRALCQRWPECRHNDIDTSGPQPMLREWSGPRFTAVPSPHCGAIVTAHLESILDREAPGWRYLSPIAYCIHTYRVGRSVEYKDKDSRLSAACAAVDAVLTAKGKSDA